MVPFTVTVSEIYTLDYSGLKFVSQILKNMTMIIISINLYGYINSLVQTSPF